MSDIELINFESTQAALDSAGNEFMALVDGGKDIAANYQSYPDERPGQTYVRTHELEHSVQQTYVIRGEVASMVITAEAIASYYTRGDAQGYDGAWMHKGRWTPARKINEMGVARVLDLIKTRLTYFLKFKFR